MKLNKLTKPDLLNVAASLQINIADSDAQVYLDSLDTLWTAYDYVSSSSQQVQALDYSERSYSIPERKDNVYNAWQCVTTIKESNAGPLSNKTLAIKDNILVAGLPMRNGSHVLNDFVADVDAEVVKRVLAAGAVIKGKANCENLCLSGASHTCFSGPVLNPHNIKYSTGGSSSGCAALLAADNVDLAIGCDQGGSVRIPASFSGIVAMKPTHGLIPYSGIMPIELTLDTVGTMSRNVVDNAMLLQVLAGRDGLDPRQYDLQIKNYTKRLDDPINNLKIAVVDEAFTVAGIEQCVIDKVNAAASVLQTMGAQVDRISIPEHADGLAIWQVIAVEGLMNMMMNANGYNWRGQYLPALSDAIAKWREYTDQLSPSLKSILIAAQYLKQRYHGRFYAQAQNLSRSLKAAYKRAFADYDILLMPTTPMRATLIPDVADTRLSLQRSNEMLDNTAPFNVTGQPALSIPCGLVDGLPVSMMLVADDYQEDVLYQVAHQFEKTLNFGSLADKKDVEVFSESHC